MSTKPALDYDFSKQPDDTDHSDEVDTRLRLHTDDLIPGVAGEVVLYNDSALRELVLEAPCAPIDVGVVDEHVTAEGLDVSGYRFVRFHAELIVFHSADTDVVIVEPGS